MGQKMVCFGQLRPTRSRQDESIEVGEVGSKRPSSGCNGVHVTWWGPLIARSSFWSGSSAQQFLFRVRPTQAEFQYGLGKCLRVCFRRSKSHVIWRADL
jgi:hypothetical protein